MKFVYLQIIATNPTFSIHIQQVKSISAFTDEFIQIFQINNFSVDYASLYINWANTSFFIIPVTLRTLKLPIKSHSSSKQQFFTDIVLVSNYYGCKGEAIKLIPYYIIDIICKTIRPSHLKKLQIIRNINNLMFQAIFIFPN